MNQNNISFESVIKGLECCQECDGYTCRNCCPYHDRNEPEDQPTCICHLAHDAIALLKAQEPRVMTWHEVIGAVLECKPVFIEVKDSEDKERGDDRWAMLTQYKDSITNGMICAMSSYITSEILFEDWYGKTWRCWTSKPTNKQRQETKWV
jgi:hypothetical protein